MTFITSGTPNVLAMRAASSALVATSLFNNGNDNMRTTPTFGLRQIPLSMIVSNVAIMRLAPATSKSLNVGIWREAVHAG